MFNRNSIGPAPAPNDEIIFDQIYDFKNLRNQIPIISSNSNETKSKLAMPLIATGNSTSNRTRSFFNENLDFQLPLIEKTPVRPISRTNFSRIDQQTLESVKIKTRRIPANFVIPSSPDEARRSLRQLAQKRPETTENVVRRSETSFEVSEPIENQQKRTSPTFETKKTENRTRFYQTHRLIVYKGFIQDQSDQYKHFEQKNLEIWPRISMILRRLEKILYEFSVPIGIVDGERVVELVKFIGEERRANDEEIISTLLNREDVDIFVKIPDKFESRRETNFYSDFDRFQAALCIQKNFRSCRIRRRYVELMKRRRAAARLILFAFRRYLKLKKLREKVKENHQRCLKSFERNQEKLKENWNQLSSNRRVIVHIPSLAFPQEVREQIGEISLRENFQIGRLCDLKDPNVDLIFVSPISISDDINQYYYKLIGLRPMVEQGNEQVSLGSINQIGERLTIVVPETLKISQFEKFCLATKLRYSPSALKQIKTLIDNRPGFIVTGFTHVDDLFIGDFLDLPIFGCEPELSYLYSTKSGSKRIFRTSNVPMPFGEFDIYNERQLFQSLAQLIIEHFEIDRWLFKIDDFIDGLGIAFCDVKKHFSSIPGDFSRSKKERLEKILDELPSILEKETKFVNQSQFESWSSFLQVFLSHGGIIEAFPASDSIQTVTICLSIEPNGRHSVICSSNQIHVESIFSNWAFSFPQNSIEPSKLNEISEKIVEQCQQRNIYGDIEIDCVVFTDRITNEENLWLIDLSIGYSESRAIFNLFSFLTMAKFDEQKHLLILRTRENKRKLTNWQNAGSNQKFIEQEFCFIATSKLYHKHLSTLSYTEFFNFCREKTVGFDIRKRRGTIFTLLQDENHEHLGLMTIADQSQMAQLNFLNVLKLILSELNDNEENNIRIAIEQISTNFGLQSSS